MTRGEISLNRDRDVKKYKLVTIPFIPQTCVKGHILNKVVVDFDKKYIIGYKCEECNKIYILYKDYKTWMMCKTFRNANWDESSVKKSEEFLMKRPNWSFDRMHFERCYIRLSNFKFKKNKYGCSHKIPKTLVLPSPSQARRVQVYFDDIEYIVYMTEEDFEKVAEYFIEHVDPIDKERANEILKNKQEKIEIQKKKEDEEKQIANYYGRKEAEPLGVYKERNPRDKRYKSKRSFFS